MFTLHVSMLTCKFFCLTSSPDYTDLAIIYKQSDADSLYLQQYYAWIDGQLTPNFYWTWSNGHHFYPWADNKPDSGDGCVYINSDEKRWDWSRHFSPVLHLFLKHLQITCTSFNCWTFFLCMLCFIFCNILNIFQAPFFAVNHFYLLLLLKRLLCVIWHVTFNFIKYCGKESSLQCNR